MKQAGCPDSLLLSAVGIWQFQAIERPDCASECESGHPIYSG